MTNKIDWAMLPQMLIAAVKANPMPPLKPKRKRAKRAKRATSAAISSTKGERSPS